MSFYGITDYITYLLGVVAIVLLPGPNSMYCLFIASSQGVKDGYKAVSAIITGDFILMTSAVFGATTLLKTSATIFTIFKILGGIYLFYIGINLLIDVYKAIKNAKQNKLASIEKTLNQKKTKKTNKVFLKSLTLSLSNPKAILFFLSFFLQFVEPSYPNPLLSFAILGISLQIISFIYLSILVFAGTNLVNYFNNRIYLASTGKASVGVMFISFAMSLWNAQV
ncbi:MAG: leucine efflux protein LeuE [Moraxellaceae bacterium]|nr:leucine efflux protein LeuE [Moraxellaceae bacterium]